MTDKSLIYSWAAGFLDGEGTLTLNKFYRKDVRNDVWAAIQCGMAQSPENVKALSILKDLFGGYLAENKKAYTENQRKTCFWRITSQKANKCAKALLPYLIIKNKQAEIIIEYQESVKDKRWHRGLPRGATMPKAIEDYRKGLIEDIRKLNKRGL